MAASRIPKSVHQLIRNKRILLHTQKSQNTFPKQNSFYLKPSQYFSPLSSSTNHKYILYQNQKRICSHELGGPITNINGGSLHSTTTCNTCRTHLTMITRSFASGTQPNNDVSLLRRDGGMSPNSISGTDVRHKGEDESVPNMEEEFADHRVAYGSKTTWELARTSLFFFLFRYRIFTDYSEKLMNQMKRFLGQRISDSILKKFIYGQFVAGETTNEIQTVVRRMQDEGIGPLIAVPIEDDIGDHVTETRSSGEENLDNNLQKILDCIDLCTSLSGSNPMFQLKMTALMSPELTRALSVACGDVIALSPTAVQTLVQGLKGHTMDVPTGWEDFLDSYGEELQRVLKRFQAINEKILQTDTVAMVDAEYTYLNPALRHLTFAMKEICNQQKPLVFYTYQAYLKRTFPSLKSDLDFARSRNLCFGAKLVRGAYIVKERHLAQVQGYPDPVNDDFEATTESYRRCLDSLLHTASEDEARIRFIIASHNEDSIRYAFHKMKELGLEDNSKAILFGQLYGMADHVSYTLGKKGYNVVKSLPYGSVEDTVPYLSRRAQENRSIFDNVRKEKQLVRKALRERILGQA